MRVSFTLCCTPFLLSMNEERLQFHLETDDYFGTLATVLDLMKQTVDREGYKKDNDALLEKLRDDLVYLQTHYSIVPRNTLEKV